MLRLDQAKAKLKQTVVQAKAEVEKMAAVARVDAEIKKEQAII